MIGTMALAGIVMVLAIFVTLSRVFNMRIVLGYATEIDVLFSVLLIVIFSGTFTGLLSAAFAGLTLAVLLTIGRVIFGYTRFRVVRYQRKVGLAKVHTAPRWKDIAERYIDKRKTEWVFTRTSDVAST